jgi:hypothetical protein
MKAKMPKAAVSPLSDGDEGQADGEQDVAEEHGGLPSELAD